MSWISWFLFSAIVLILVVLNIGPEGCLTAGLAGVAMAFLASWIPMPFGIQLFVFGGVLALTFIVLKKWDIKSDRLRISKWEELQNHTKTPLSTQEEIAIITQASKESSGNMRAQWQGQSWGAVAESTQKNQTFNEGEPVKVIGRDGTFLVIKKITT